MAIEKGEEICLLFREKKPYVLLMREGGALHLFSLGSTTCFPYPAQYLARPRSIFRDESAYSEEGYSIC